MMHTFSPDCILKRINIQKNLFIWILLAIVTANNLVRAAVPAIASISPLSGPVGTQVTITGSNFSASTGENIIFFGSVQAEITGTPSTTQLTVIVPAGATYQQISVLVNGLRATSTLYFTVTSTFNCALTKHSFDAKIDFATGLIPSAIVSGDINNDGKIDMAVANLLDASVTVYQNISSATTVNFSSNTIDIGGGINPTTVLLEDLDGDQKPELIVSNNSDTIISVYPNISINGNIIFGSREEVALPTGSLAKKITVADLDLDGKPDIIAAHNNKMRISVIRNMSSAIGNFTFDQAVTYGLPENPEAIITGDLNEDKLPEIIVTFGGNGAIVIFKNNGSLNGFNEQSFYPTATLNTFGIGANAVKLADFNGDHLLDIAVVNYGSNATNRSVTVCENTTIIEGVKGTPVVAFANGIKYTVPEKVSDLSIADFNGDGRADIAACIEQANSAALYLNTLTDGGTIDAASFTKPVSFAVGLWPRAITIADFNGDGNADLALANAGGGTVSVLNRTIQTAPSGSLYFPGYEKVKTSCPLTEVTMEVQLKGKSPWSIKYMLNNSTATTETVTDIISTNDDYTYLLKVSPETTTSYQLIYINDGQQCDAFKIYPEFENKNIRITIPETPLIKPNTIHNAAAGSAYNQPLTLVPASTPLGWSASSGLPTGLTLANGVISGTPTIRNTYTFVVSASFNPCAAVKQYSLLISDNSTTWNGTAWSNGKPVSTKDAIIDGNYNSAVNGVFSCYHLVVNESDTLFIKDKNTITVNGNVINNGAIYKDCSVTFAIAGSSVGPAPKIVQPQILPAFFASGLINLSYQQPLKISIGESPTYTIINNLPSGLALAGSVIKGTPDKTGRYDFSIHSTEYNGLCEAAGNFSIYIETADPNLKFPANGLTKIAGTAPFVYKCTSQSKGLITYSMEPANGCATVNASTGEITISCGGPVKQYTLTAIQAADFVFNADTAKSILSIEKMRPSLHFLKTGYVLGSTAGNTIQYQTNSIGAITIFQIDNNQTAQVSPDGVVIPIAEGSFNILFKIAETETTSHLDTIVTMGIYSSFVRPISASIYVDLEVGEDTVINILTDAQGITGVVQASLTDIDIENIGIQSKFYSTSLGNFLIDDKGNLSIKPFDGFIGSVKIGYVLTDENGTKSDIYYINVNVKPPYVIPPLKANEVMTPNNDGLNDSFVIAYIDQTKENSLVIADENGYVIYKAANYQNTWAGTDSKGNTLEPGIYYFAFNENKSNRSLNGYIQILK